MPKEEEQPILSGNFTASDLAKLMQTMSASQKEVMNEFAKTLAANIVHPEPSSKQREHALRTMADRNKQAAENEAAREYKRKHCMAPANPDIPHRRSGQQWQNWNNTPVIAWMYTYMTEKTPTGSREVGPVAFGVCQWCGTEFKPGDADYMEALSWGQGMNTGTHAMNVHTGLWING